ncbi:MAG: zinc-finger domain-containing protein [Rickettsia sp.]|nr:zinc-finger domain-containing protein [Rickettsia sp.]
MVEYIGLKREVKNIVCLGYKKNLDHPLIFLSIEKGETITCPYCAKLYKYSDQ